MIGLYKLGRLKGNSTHAIGRHLGIMIGIFFIIPNIFFIRTKDWYKVARPFFLITLPVYYMLFGVLAMDGTAILKEFPY